MNALGDLNFEYGEYEDMPGFWVEIKSIKAECVVAGGHFNTKKEVFGFFIKSKRYFGERLKGKVEVK